MGKKITIKIDKDEIVSIMRLIKELSGVDDSLEAAIEYALFYANSEEQRKITFLQELLRGVASGTVELSFNVHKLYQEV